MALNILGGASDLLTIFKSGGTAITAGVDQDWATMSAALATIAGKSLVFASKINPTLKGVTKDEANLKWGSATYILDLTGLAILSIDLLGGFGTPETGEDVPLALERFSYYSETLAKQCIPDPRDWSGDAATAYTNQVNALIDYTATMQAYDQELQQLLATQGDAVRQAHLAISICFAGLTAATGVALFLYLIKPPPWGKFASIAFQISVAVIAIAEVIGFEIQTAVIGEGTRAGTDILMAKYEALAADINQRMAGTSGQTVVPEAKRTSSYASDFESISDGRSSYAAPPDVASMAAAAGDRVSPLQQVLLDASAEQEAAAYRATDEARATADAAQTQTAAPATAVATPTLPAFTLPSPAQAVQTTVQAASVSQNVAQPIYQRVQQYTQVAQSQQGAGPAAEDAAAASPADETATGAAAGTDGVQRAPIDTPTGDTENAATGRGQVL